MALGYYKLGGVILIINAILTFPLGFMASFFPGLSAYRFGKVRNFYMTSGVPAPPYLAKRFKTPSRNMKIAAIICIILVIILPFAYLNFFTKKPDLNIQYLEIRPVDGGSAINVSVKLRNYGEAYAYRENIEMKFKLTHQTVERPWSSWSIDPDESIVGYFEITLITRDEELEKATVYFLGAKMDTYEMENT